MKRYFRGDNRDKDERRECEEIMDSRQNWPSVRCIYICVVSSLLFYNPTQLRRFHHSVEGKNLIVFSMLDCL